MYLLTKDRRVKSQLSLLLRDLGYSIKCIASFDELNCALADESENEILLLDLQVEPTNEALLTVRTHTAGIKIIGIEQFDSDTAKSTPDRVAGLDQCIILPKHSERAKSRLNTALRHIPPTKQNSKRSTPNAIKFKRPASRFSLKATNKHRPIAQGAPVTSSRYIAAHSLAALTFIEQLNNETPNKIITILTGEEGCEFELGARELNYQDNNDSIPLHVITDDSFNTKTLEIMERAASKENERINCYIGRTDDLTKEAVEKLEHVLEYLDNIRLPHMRIILAHEFESEAVFKHDTTEPLQALLKKERPVHIPPMRERAEDIAPICHSLIGILRAAHPFLAVHSITSETIQYLIESRQNLSHNKLVRTLRNSIALSRSNALSIEDMKNYGESDTTTQHLLESMADEGFFPTSDAANL